MFSSSFSRATPLRVSNSSLKYHLLLLLALLTQPSACLNPSASVAINQVPAWSLQPHCGMGCLQNDYDGGKDLQDALGCTINACYCGTAYQSLATSYISSCWKAYCGAAEAAVTVDISNAIGIYNTYCAVGVEASTTVAAIATGQATVISTPASTTLNNNNAFPSQTGSSSTAAASPTASSKSSSSLSSGGVIGIAVSVGCSVIGLIFTIGFKIWKHRQAAKKERLNQQQMGQRGLYGY